MKFPRELTFEVISIKTFGAEVRINHLAVGSRRGCSIGTLAVAIVVGSSLPGSLLPQYLARIAIQSKDLEGMFAIGADAVGMDKLLITQHVLCRLCSRNSRAFNGRGYKHHLPPNDGR